MCDFMHDELVVNGQSTTRDDVIAGLEGHIDAVPDLTWRVTNIAVEVECVAAVFSNTGTPVEEGLGARPSGATVEYAELVFHKVRDGRFRALNFLLDTETVRSQLGS